MTVYLLHSTVALGGEGRSSARHYLGWCEEKDLARRLWQHQHGQAGCAITRAFIERGATLLLVHTWPEGDRSLERYLKRMGHHERNCPLCKDPMNPTAAQMTLPTVDPYNAPSFRRYRKRTTGSGGGSSHGSQIDSTGASLAAQPLVTGTPSASNEQPTSALPGGSGSGVAVPPTPPGGGFAGTKQPSTSTGTTTHEPFEDEQNGRHRPLKKHPWRTWTLPPGRQQPEWPTSENPTKETSETTS